MNFKPYSASGLEHFIVALTNYQKLNGSKQHLNFSYRSEVWLGPPQAKIEVSAGPWFLLEAWGQNLLLCLPALLAGFSSLWRWAWGPPPLQAVARATFLPLPPSPPWPLCGPRVWSPASASSGAPVLVCQGWLTWLRICPLPEEACCFIGSCGWMVHMETQENHPTSKSLILITSSMASLLCNLSCSWVNIFGSHWSACYSESFPLDWRQLLISFTFISFTSKPLHLCTILNYPGVLLLGHFVSLTCWKVEKMVNSDFYKNIKYCFSFQWYRKKIGKSFLACSTGHPAKANRYLCKWWAL